MTITLDKILEVLTPPQKGRLAYHERVILDGCINEIERTSSNPWPRLFLLYRRDRKKFIERGVEESVIKFYDDKLTTVTYHLTSVPTGIGRLD